MNPIRQALRRSLFTSALRASGAPPGATDDPKFYSMVLEFTESAADILEQQLLEDTEVELGRHETIKKAQRDAAKRSVEQKKLAIKGNVTKVILAYHKGLEITMKYRYLRLYAPMQIDFGNQLSRSHGRWIAKSLFRLPCPTLPPQTPNQGWYEICTRC